MEDIDDPNNKHRHVNHLIGVHPGRQIHPTTSPELARAAKVSVVARGNGKTGWSKIWKSCIFARLLEAEKSYELLRDVLVTKTYGNLWTTHPPFQIDCNFGFAAAVGEMLVQSHMGYVHLLPALPKEWDEGNFRGMQVRGGFELDLEWQKGQLESLVVKNIANREGECRLVLGDRAITLSISQGDVQTIGKEAFKPIP